MKAQDQIDQKSVTSDLSRDEQLSLLSSMLSSMGDAIIAADKDGKFLVFNPAAECMFGQGAFEMDASEWPNHFGLFLPDKITPFSPDHCRSHARFAARR